MSLRILHTESSLGWGGQEIRILSESRGLIERGHYIVLLTPPEARIHAEAKKWGVPAVALPIAKKRLAGLSALQSWFKAHPADVVSCHSSTDSWLAALALLRLGRPMPLVRTRHISAPVPQNMLSRWLYTRATARIVTAGESLRKELIERNGFPAERIESVPTGIDGERFRPGERDAARKQTGLPLEQTLVGIVATLRSWKGHRFLVEAVAGLPQDIGLVIVGDGPQRAALELLVDQQNIRGRTWFAGNQADVVPWLQSLDVFALPSYANEGVPQALLQAMLVGLPCVTTDAGSIGEIAKPEDTALVVAKEDVPALRSALQRLIDDRSLARRLGDAARKHCLKEYSYETMLDRMERIYRDCRR